MALALIHLASGHSLFRRLVAVVCVLVRVTSVRVRSDWCACALCEASSASGPVASVPCCCVSGRCPWGAVDVTGGGETPKRGPGLTEWRGEETT